MRVAVVLFICLTAGCGAEGKHEWRQKYADCQVLAKAFKNDPAPFFKPPDCEKIPQLCSKDEKSAACTAELGKYYRKS